MVHSRPSVVNYTPERRIALRHPLILDGFFRLRAIGAPSRRARLTPPRAARNCACTFYLVFKEPVSCDAPLRVFRVVGNLTILPSRLLLVNPFPILFRDFVFGVATSSYENRAAGNGWGLRAEGLSCGSRSENQYYAPVSGLSTPRVSARNLNPFPTARRRTRAPDGTLNIRTAAASVKLNRSRQPAFSSQFPALGSQRSRSRDFNRRCCRC